MDAFQFYPTPPALAERAWRKFKNKNIVRVLEPSAGDGALAEANKVLGYHDRVPTIDCCEIDITKHGVLRDKDLNVIGVDFLQFSSGSIYSHVVMNPPFNDGVKHVLKAWDICWDAEIVAIINAETLRNPFSKERQFLVDLIERYGEVEFIEYAFMVPEAERKAEVDIALVYLRKEANVEDDIIGDLLGDLRREADTAKTLAGDYQEIAALALPSSLIENSVAAFNAAVKAMRDSVFSEARATYYSNLLGETMAVRNGAGESDGSEKAKASAAHVQKEIAKRYLKLKDRAWSGILRSTNVTSKLSSAAQKRLESQFEEIKQLEFTASNCYGFLCGIVEKRGEIQLGMACDVFDAITRYHSDNTVFYRGWKSNDAHRTCGMRIKTTRFILPHHATGAYHNGLKWESEQLLRDFDKVFAMLDGKLEPEVGLCDVFRGQFLALRCGSRISSSYFDVRYYPGIGTIHFFATNKELVDRLNRLVGKQRQWLPPEGARVSEAFWLQFDQAEKLDKEVRAELSKTKNHNFWDYPLDNLFSADAGTRAKAEQAMDRAATNVQERHGINVDFQVEEQGQMLLLAA